LRLPALALLAWSLLGATPGPWAAAGGIVALLSHDAPPYEEALAGFREHLGGTAGAPPVEVVALGGDPEKARTAVQRAVASGARLILAAGSLAAEAACAQTHVPVVATLVLDPGGLPKGPRITGIGLAIPPGVQLGWLKRLLPGRTRIGVLYTPEENASFVEEVRELARSAGLELVAQEVRSPKDLPGALEALGRRADVLWGLPDHAVYTAQTAKAILLFSFRNRIPLVGLSDAWVKAGALYALEPDYRDLGAQSAELAAALLGRPGAPPPAPAVPRSAHLSVSLKTARQMKIDLPEALVRGARTVHE
jgi:putative ABC transport system substrate-binding protein